MKRLGVIMIAVVGMVAAQQSALRLYHHLYGEVPPPAAAEIPAAERGLAIAPIYREIRLPSILVEDQPHVQQTFRVANTTNRIVRFTKIIPSCTCSMASLDSMHLQPGQETTLRMEFDLRERTGPQRFLCELIEDCNNVWTYDIATTVYERISFQPRLIRFGLVDPNTEHVRPVELHIVSRKRTQPPTIRPPQPESSHLHVRTTATDDKTLPGDLVQRTVRLALTLSTPVNPGFSQADVIGL
jgi:hypothetical protein